MSKYTIEDLKTIAQKKGGKCLSEIYTSYKLSWECKNGHRWESRPDAILSGSWCAICFYNKITFDINYCKKLAKNRKGECLSSYYINMNKKLLWKCHRNHTWEARPSNIYSGRWCPHCSGRNNITLQKLKQLAKNRDGKCLSTEYKNIGHHILWECDKGHTWLATPRNIIHKKSWCPKCNVSIFEKECRRIFEKIFLKEFEKIRHPLLRNPKTNFKLELDGYNDDLKIAFEYNGRQHYRRNPLFHTKQQFEELQYRDKVKSKLCKINRIELIIIPFNIRYDDLEKFITKKLQ